MSGYRVFVLVLVDERDPLRAIAAGEAPRGSRRVLVEPQRACGAKAPDGACTNEELYASIAARA